MNQEPERVKTPLSLNPYVVIWSLSGWHNKVLGGEIKKLAAKKAMQQPQGLNRMRPRVTA